MGTRGSEPQSASDSVPAEDLSPSRRRARIAELERELARLKVASDGAPERLTTVKVPAQFEQPFLRAQEYVSRYFADRIEHPDTATISIAGERYVLLRAASLSVEFVEMVMKLYQDKGADEARSVANNLLFDLAHAIGKADARSFQQKMAVSDPIATLSAGPIHFAFSGWAFVDISAESRPSPDEDYFLLYDHPFSFESHSWLAKDKRSDAPVCIMNSGYSSGWCEESFGIPLVAAEVECLAAGGECCRFIMAPPARIEAHLEDYARRHGVRPGAAAGSRPGVVPEFFQRKRLEEELRAANEQLELRVQTRTLDLERVSEQLRHQALHDALTGLPNRVLLHDRIEQAILNVRRRGMQFSLLFLDLDGFKEINDTFGHHVGDALLAKIGTRLRDRLPAPDIIARLGGDEFAMLLDHPGSAEAAAEAGRKLLDALEQAFEIDGHKLVVSASIGIAHCPSHGTDPATLMRRADVAMYAAKAARAGTMVYSPQQDEHSPGRIRLVNELRDSIDDRHLELDYQPEIDLRSGVVVRVEALIRWNHPERGRLLPDEFLPLVASSDLIDRIARWVLRTAIRDCSDWKQSGLGIGVSVNLSPHNLRDRSLPDFIARTLAQAHVEPARLTVEITESGVLEQAVLEMGIFKRLREIGVGLSIDDFGTGYSSLMHLKQLPFTELKVDRSFTSELASNEHDAAIVRSTIHLGHELGRGIVAEGVESREVLDLLRRFGCDFAQGYFISPPLGKAALRTWLRDTPAFDLAR